VLGDIDVRYKMDENAYFFKLSKNVFFIFITTIESCKWSFLTVSILTNTSTVFPLPDQERYAFREGRGLDM
jgi:hypothetical protein